MPQAPTSTQGRRVRVVAHVLPETFDRLQADKTKRPGTRAAEILDEHA